MLLQQIRTRNTTSKPHRNTSLPILPPRSHHDGTTLFPPHSALILPEQYERSEPSKKATFGAMAKFKSDQRNITIDNCEDTYVRPLATKLGGEIGDQWEDSVAGVEVTCKWQKNRVRCICAAVG
jgi:hypothetical protein